MALVGYYDKSDTFDQSGTFLAGYLADASVWERLRQPWLEILHRHGYSYFHGRESINPEARMELGRCLVQVVNDGLFGTVCYLRRQDYDQACRILPNGIPEFSRVMVGVVVNMAIKRLRTDPRHQDQKLALVFDRGEPFFAHLQKEWEEDRTSAQPKPWGSYIEDISTDSLQESIGLQAADYIAWHARRHHTERGFQPSTTGGDGWKNLWAALLTLSTFGDVQKIDTDSLVSWYSTPSDSGF